MQSKRKSPKRPRKRPIIHTQASVFVVFNRLITGKLIPRKIQVIRLHNHGRNSKEDNKQKHRATSLVRPVSPVHGQFQKQESTPVFLLDLASSPRYDAHRSIVWAVAKRHCYHSPPCKRNVEQRLVDDVVLCAEVIVEHIRTDLIEAQPEVGTETELDFVYRNPTSDRSRSTSYRS